MNTSTLPQPDHVPSLRTLMTTTVVALVAAIVLLLTAVLPAEHGIDPLGAGRLLGLTAMSSPPVEDRALPADSERPKPQLDGPIAHYGAEYKVDSRELVLGPYEYVEYKYRLEPGASLVYAWSAIGDTPIYDFHADPDGTPKPDPVSFDKRSKRQANGTYTAGFAGIHGWFWENPGGEPLTIRLTTAGFYSTATEFRSNRTRREHALTPVKWGQVLN